MSYYAPYMILLSISLFGLGVGLIVDALTKRKQSNRWR